MQERYKVLSKVTGETGSTAVNRAPLKGISILGSEERRYHHVGYIEHKITHVLSTHKEMNIRTSGQLLCMMCPLSVNEAQLRERLRIDPIYKSTHDAYLEIAPHKCSITYYITRSHGHKFSTTGWWCPTPPPLSSTIRCSTSPIYTAYRAFI